MNSSSILSSPERRVAFWLLAFALFCAALWALGDVLLPFVLGLAVAYIVGPAADRIESFGFSRRAAALLIVGGFFVLVFAALGFVLPAAFHEAVQFAGDVPEMVRKAKEVLAPWVGWIEQRFNITDTDRLRAAIEARIGDAAGAGGALGGQILAGLQAGGEALAGFLTVLFLTPIVSFFTIKEWPAMREWFHDLLPRRHAGTVSGLFGQIGTRLSGFVRGQLTVCAILGVLYTAALTLAGLRYGIVIGLCAGALSIIPLVGSTVGLLAGVLVAWFQTGDWTYVLTIAAIFVAGQILEGNFLTPKIIGDRVGLHPLWILFALMAGGALFSIVGMLLAVPAAIVVGVLSSFAIRQYKVSPLYRESASPSSESAHDTGSGPPDSV